MCAAPALVRVPPMTADAALLSALADLERALNEIGRPAMIIGGIAVIASGVPRQTIDIDATVGLTARRSTSSRALFGTTGSSRESPTPSHSRGSIRPSSSRLDRPRAGACAGAGVRRGAGGAGAGGWIRSAARARTRPLTPVAPRTAPVAPRRRVVCRGGRRPASRARRRVPDARGGFPGVTSRRVRARAQLTETAGSSSSWASPSSRTFSSRGAVRMYARSSCHASRSSPNCPRSYRAGSSPRIRT
jgi:hypothetical protein